MSVRSTLRRVLCAALAVGTALLFAAPADAADPVDAPALPVTVHVDEIAPAVLQPGQDLVVRATVTNTTADVIEAPVASLRLSRFNVATRDDLDTWTTSTTCASKSPCRQVATFALPGPLTPGQSAPVELSVPADEVNLTDLPDTWGPRGLSVEVMDGRTRVGLERTFVLWYTTDAKVERTPVSVLVPVVGPATDPLQASSDALDRLVSPGGRLDTLATTLEANPAIGVAVDPALLDQAAHGSSRAQEWGSALDADLAHHDVLVLPWSDPDVGAAGHAGQPGLVQLAVDASTGADADGAGVLWTPTGGGLDQASLAVTAQVHQAAVVVAPGSIAVDKPKKGRTPTAPTSVHTAAGTVRALVPDERLSALLVGPTSVDPQATPATTAQQALAELAVVSREASSDQPRLLMTAGRDWSPDAPSVAALVAALDDAPWVSLDDVSTLLDGSATGKGTLPERSDDPAGLAPDTVGSLAAAREQAIAFATVTDQPDQLLAGVDAEVVAPLAVAWRAEPAQRAALVDRVLADLTARTSGLSIGQLGAVNVISSTGTIRMSVTNDLTVPVKVLLTVQPRKACLEAVDVAPVSVPAESATVVPVTLHAHANCDVVVVSQLTAADGTPVSPSVSFVAHVTPTIESVGTKVVGVLLAIGLVLGIARTIRRGQSARRGSRIDKPVPPSSEPSSPEPSSPQPPSSQPSSGPERVPVPDEPDS